MRRTGKGRKEGRVWAVEEREARERGRAGSSLSLRVLGGGFRVDLSEIVDFE